MAAAAPLDELAARRPAVRGFLLKLTRDPDLADDLAQEALLRAVRAFPRLRGEASPGTWITAIALNLARDHFRALRRAPETVEVSDASEMAVEAAAESDVLQAEMSACILGHVARLSPRQQQVVLLRHFGGLDHAEIARQLGVSTAPPASSSIARLPLYVAASPKDASSTSATRSPATGGDRRHASGRRPLPVVRAADGQSARAADAPPSPATLGKVARRPDGVWSRADCGVFAAPAPQQIFSGFVSAFRTPSGLRPPSPTSLEKERPSSPARAGEGDRA